MFKNDNLFPRVMAKMKVLKGLCQAILDGSILYETILVFMNQNGDNGLKSVGQKLSDELYRTVEKGDRPIIRDRRRAHLSLTCLLPKAQQLFVTIVDLFSC